MSPKLRSAKNFGKVFVGAAAVVGLGVAIAPSLTIKGVPLPIILKFVTDGPAREAYFARDEAILHDRLQELNVENEIKDFYRPQFQNEQELDLHIHQVFYDLSGYVGKSYVVTAQGTLRLRDLDFQFWARLAEEVGVISDSYYGDDGLPYVVSQEGIVTRYETVATLYPKEWLKKRLRQQRRGQNS